MFLSLSLSLSLSFLCVCGYCENKIYFTTKARKVSFFSRVVCEEDEPTTCVLDKKKRKERHKPPAFRREIREIFADRLSQTAEQEKRHTCSEIFVKKAKQKISHISLFSLSLSPKRVLVVCALRLGDTNRIQLNLFLQEESFHDERRRETGKRVYHVPSRRRRIGFLVFVEEY